MEEGVTVTEDPLSDPGIHAYVDAPPAVMVTVLPVQMVELDGVSVIVGAGFTVTTTVPVRVQPVVVLVFVSTYVVVAAGEAFVVAAVGADRPAVGDQLYVQPAVVDPARDVVPPGQMETAVGVMVSVGAGFTVMVRVAVPVQPAVVPVTVYVVVVVGETVTDVPVSDPGIHV